MRFLLWIRGGKFTKRVIDIILVIFFMFSILGYAYSEVAIENLDKLGVAEVTEKNDILTIKDAELIAEGLNELRILKGSDKGFELGKPLTRAEGITFIVRLLDKDEEVQNSEYKNPFKDIPKWAEKNVSYMYGKGMTTGISKDPI